MDVQAMLEPAWLDAFEAAFRLCKVQPGECVAVLAETRSRPVNLALAEVALHRLGVRPLRLVLPGAPATAPVPVRSSGATRVLAGHPGALAALAASTFVVDLTVEGLLHAPELKAILGAGSRVLMVSDEHPETLERLVPRPGDDVQAKAAVKRARAARLMHVTSAAGTDLQVRMEGAPVVGVWGWTDRPGTLAHWPGGVLVAFPAAGSVRGRLVLDAGDVNLSFKRYIERPIALTIEDDHVTAIEGSGADAQMMRRHLEAWDDRSAYAVSHVGWGLNRRARYEALAMHGRGDTNGTELRCVAGNFLFSTGANEFANRFTEGHFDIPMFNTTITLDGEVVVRDGALVE
jgi:2,5-dihydroxypyridine 5,6-dioxygenase